MDQHYAWLHSYPSSAKSKAHGKGCAPTPHVHRGDLVISVVIRTKSEHETCTGSQVSSKTIAQCRSSPRSSFISKSTTYQSQNVIRYNPEYLYTTKTQFMAWTLQTLTESDTESAYDCPYLRAHKPLSKHYSFANPHQTCFSLPTIMMTHYHSPPVHTNQSPSVSPIDHLRSPTVLAPPQTLELPWLTVPTHP